MEFYTTRLESFTKPRRVKHSTTKRTLSLKWPHSSHFIATPDTLTEAGFFFNPSWDARDNVECYCCGKCLDGWDEEDDPFAIHWEKCKDRCAWAIVRCGIPADIDRKGNFAFKDPSREPDGNAMKKARLATFKVNDSWPHDRVKGHGAHSAKMAKAGFVFTPQTPGDDTGTCLYCGVSLGGWDEDDDPLEEHQKRVTKSNLPCPFFLEAPAPKQKSKTTSRSTVRPKSRAGSKQPQTAPSDTSSSHSEDDSQPEPAPLRQSKRSRTTSMMSTTKEKDTSDTLRRSTRSSRAKPPAEVEDTSSGTELRRSTSGRGRSKSLAKTKAKEPIEVIEEADEDEAPRAAQPKKQRVKGKENVAQDVKVQKPSRKTKALRMNDTDEESRQPKHDRPKKTKVIKDESTSGVDSEKEVQPTVKRRNIVPSTSSVEEETDEEIKPKKGPRSAKPKRKAPIVEDESVSDQPDDADAEGLPLTKKAAPSKPFHKPRAKPEAILDSDGTSDEEPEKLTEQTTDSLRPVKPSKGKSAATRGASEAEFSQSSDNEKTTTPPPVPTENSVRAAKGKGSTSANATVLHHDRTRSQTTSGSSSSKPLLSLRNVEPVTGSYQADVMDVDSDVASAPDGPSQGTMDAKRADVPTPLSDGDAPEDIVDMTSPAPPARLARSPPRLTSNCQPREESPATPPPASSSLLSVSSITSTTRAESHTDAETLVEPLPLQVNGAQLTEEERLMTVEEWIRQEIEVHYERLRRDGEMKIKLFKERAEEVRRQIESL